jgi:DNA-binding MarR family transcriptional regulator
VPSSSSGAVRAGRAAEPAAVADRLHSAAIHLLRRVRQEDERTGISPGRLSALSVLVFGGAMRATDLARAEQVKPPTMTRIVAALEADGLVRRRPVSDDARAAILEATPRGVRVMQEGRRRRVARLAASLERLEPRELELLARAAGLIEELSAAL